MSLVKCSGCGKEISDKAGMCPHCGYKKPKPKRFSVCHSPVGGRRTETPDEKKMKVIILSVIGAIFAVIVLADWLPDVRKGIKSRQKRLEAKAQKKQLATQDFMNDFIAKGKPHVLKAEMYDEAFMSVWISEDLYRGFLLDKVSAQTIIQGWLKILHTQFPQEKVLCRVEIYYGNLKVACGDYAVSTVQIKIKYF